jgi:uncharacterized protein YcbX
MVLSARLAATTADVAHLRATTHAVPRRGRTVGDTRQVTPTVSQIAIAPVKSLRLSLVEQAEVGPRGVIGDRLYAMLNERGQLLSVTKHPQLLQARAAVDPTTNHLRLELPGGRLLEGAPEIGAARHGLFYGQERPCRVVLGEFSEALSDLAGEPVTLVAMSDGPAVDRPGEGAVTVQSEAALADLAPAAGCSEPLDARRFRMTFTVDGVDAYEEETWLGRRVRLGEVVIRPLGNVGRCAATTYDPETGAKTADTLKAIVATRADVPTTERMPFGVHAEVLTAGFVRIGDEVEVLD